MSKCSFCKEEMKKGRGTMYVKKDGNILHFCSNKCEKNMLKLKRNPRFFKWTGAYEKGEQ